MEILQRIPKNITCSPFMGSEKCWILTAAALAGSVASSLFGGAKARKAAQKAKAEQTYRTNAEKAWYDKQYNTDYLDTKAGQNLMRRAQEVQDEYVRKADGAAAVGGGTAASVAQAKESANKAMGDTIANIAAQDTSRKQQVADQHQSNLMQQSQARENLENQRAANTSQAAQNMSNALMTAAGSLEGKANGKSTSGLGTSKVGADTSNISQLNADAHSSAATHLSESMMTPDEKNQSRLKQAVGLSGIM